MLACLKVIFHKTDWSLEMRFCKVPTTGHTCAHTHNVMFEVCCVAGTVCVDCPVLH